MKKRFIILIAIAIIISIAISVTAGAKVLSVIETNRKARRIDWDSNSYTRDELETIYNENKEAFRAVAEIVKENEAFREKINEVGDVEGPICYPHQSKYFTEQEWSEITSLYTKVKPYMIMRSFSGNFNVVYFNFAPRKEDGKKISNSLYYLPSEAELAHCRTDRQSYGGTLYPIDDGWYICEQIQDDVPLW